jgi:hypothetical protein
MTPITSVPFARLAGILTAEIRRCAAHGVDWRNLLLARHVMAIPPAQQPAPDGSSLAYVEMAYDLGVKRRNEDAHLTELSPMLALADELLQAEIAICIVNERKLIAEVAAQ